MQLYKSIELYHKALLNQETTVSQAVDFYLQQIEQTKHLNAYVQVFAEEAKQKAIALDEAVKKGEIKGKLFGVVVSIKDVISYKGHGLSAASNILKGFTAIYNATAVEKLLAEGAIIIGSTNCDEFAMGSTNENSAYGVTKNGLKQHLVAGGSSGGSAVAVQTNTCMVSLGSDTGGSVRQPADFCGIVGFKPTYGRISRYGLIAYASSFDQIGIFANNVHDVALTLEVIAGEDEFDSTVSNQPVEAYTQCVNDAHTKYKFAYFEEAINHKGLDPEIAAAIKLQIDTLKQQGHTVEPVSLPLLDKTIPTYYVLTTAEATSNLSRYDGVKFGFRANDNFENLNDMYTKTRTQGFGIEVQRRIMLGNFVLSSGYYDAYFTKAQQVRQMLVNTTNQIFSQYDALLSPTVPTTAFAIGEKNNDPVQMYLADIYTVFANLVGINGISIPLYKHSNGMPFGLQLMCARWEDYKLLSIANSLYSTK